MSDPILHVPFAGGLNENVDERYLGPTDLARADNVSFVTDGSAEKRFGFEELTPNTGMVSIERLMPMGDRILAVDGEKLWAYNSTAASAGDDFVDLGRIAEATVLRTPVTTVNGHYDIAYGNGMIAMACIQGDDLHVEVYDATTMQLLTDPDLVLPGLAADPFRVKVGWLGTRLVVIYCTSGGGVAALRGNYVDAASISPTATDGGFQAAEITIATDMFVASGPLPFGAYFNSTNSEVFLAYKDTTANDVRILRLDNVLAIASTVSQAVNPTVNAFSVSYDGSSVVMVAMSVPAAPNTGLGLIAVSRSGWVVGATNFSTGCTVVGDSYRCSVVSTASNTWYAGLSVGDTAHANTEFTWRNFGDNCVAIGANALSAYNVAIISDMFMYGARAYLVVGHVAPVLTTGPFVTTPDPIVLPPNGAMYLVELGTDFTSAQNTLRWVATMAPNIVPARAVRDDGTITGTATVTSVGTVDAASFVTFLATNGVTQARLYLERLDVDFKDPKRWQNAELGGLLYTEGSKYDGKRISPMGWAWAPTIVSTVGAGVTTIAAGTYSYIAVYVRTLADGTTQRSAPSNAVQVVVPVGGYASVTIVVTYCGMYAEDPGYIELYRTEAGGEIYYRCASSTSEGTVNSTGSATVSITHAPATDAELTDGSHPILYNTGGAKSNATPPTFRNLLTEDNRLYAIGDDGRTVWYSKQFDDDDAPAFALEFTFTIQDTRDILTAIGVLDGRKIFFTESDIFVMGGKGPSESGQGNDYNEPDKLPYAVGCTNWRSVVTTEDGLWFQSKRGLELLTRSMELAPYQELGAKVRRTLASYPYITSAVVVPEQSQVRFTCSATDDVDDARDGRVLVWDTRLKRWSVHMYRRSQADSATCVPVTALQHNTLGYVWAWDSESDALVKREKLSTEAAPWVDYTSGWIGRTVTGPWVKTQATNGGVAPSANVQGWQRIQRVRFLGERFSAHGLSVTLGYNYQTGSDTRTFSEAVITALGSLEQVRIVPAAGKAKCSAIQVSVSDTAPATVGTGRACAFTGLTLEIHPKPGGSRNIGADAKG